MATGLRIYDEAGRITLDSNRRSLKFISSATVEITGHQYVTISLDLPAEIHNMPHDVVAFIFVEKPINNTSGGCISVGDTIVILAFSAEGSEDWVELPVGGTAHVDYYVWS